MENRKLLKPAPDLSVIIPTYNNVSYLAECLESFIHQPVNMEVIIILDGCTDGSAEIAEQYRQAYSFVTVINSNNQGPGYARNQGIRLARGRYLFFLDSDDTIIEPDLALMIAEGDRQGVYIIRGQIQVYSQLANVEYMDPGIYAFDGLSETTGQILPAYEYFYQVLMAPWTPAAWASI